MLPETALEYLKISRNLIEGFNEHLNRESLEIRTRANDAYVKAGMVLGLAVHAHQMGALALDLLERDTPIVLVAPTLRACFESALTAHWIAMSTDAAKAMFNKEVNQRRAMQKTLTDARSNTMQQMADRVAHTDLPKLVTSSKEQAKAFERMLADLDGGGPDAYAYFRMLSTFTHASASLVDRYLEEDSDPEIPFVLRVESKDPFPPTVCVNLIGCCLVWAGSAARHVQKDPRDRRNELRDAASKLGTVADIKLNYKAQLRQPRRR